MVHLSLIHISQHHAVGALLALHQQRQVQGGGALLSLDHQRAHALDVYKRQGLKNSFIPLILPSIAAPTVFFFMKQYLCLLYTSRCV